MRFLNTHISSVILTSFVIGILSVPGVTAVCPSGDVGLAAVVEPFLVLGARAERGVIVGNDCSIIDGKDDIDDASICGTYADGSTVVCSDGTQTPVSAHTFDGKDWGSCTPSTETCTNGNNGTLNSDINVEFCCAPA